MICTDVTELGIWLGATDFYKHIFCVLLLLLLLLCAENDIYLALLYQIGHTLIIASPLAISTRRKHNTHRAGRMCRAMVLKCSCIRSMTYFLLRASQGLAIYDYKSSKHLLLQTCWMVFSSCPLHLFLRLDLFLKFV